MTAKKTKKNTEPYVPSERAEDLLTVIRTEGVPSVHRGVKEWSLHLPRGLAELEDAGFSRRTIYNVLKPLREARMLRLTRHTSGSRARPVTLEIPA